MTNAAPTTFILAIPGTQETQEMPREAILEAVTRGEILPDNWVWSPTHNDWKPLAEIPELQVAPEPAVTPSFMNGQVPAAMSAHFPPAAKQAATHVPQAAAVARQATPTPQKTAAPVLSETQQLARTQYSQPQEIKREFPIFKILFFVSFLLALSVLAGNYFLVDQPFATNLASTSFSTIPAYAHLGAFSQPDALVIHVPPTKELTADNLADFMTAMAKSTPPQPFHGGPFDGVGLTSSWQSQFLMNGTAWQKLGEMTGATSTTRQKFIIDHITEVDGDPLVAHPGEDPVTLTEKETQAWQSFVASFLPKSSN